MTPLSPFSITPLKRSHIPACRAIVAASDPWKRLGESVDFKPALSPARTGVKGHACMSGSSVAGFVLFLPGPVFARGGYLRAVGVAQAFRGLGVGRLLLQFAERETAKRSPNLFLCVSSFNRNALAFYRHCGYVRAGRLPDLIRHGMTEHILWKRLDREGNRRKSKKGRQ